MSLKETASLRRCSKPSVGSDYTAVKHPSPRDLSRQLSSRCQRIFKMDLIFNCLHQHRLDAYYGQFLTLGVKDEHDFADGVTAEDLDKMGLSQVEKNRFAKMKASIQRVKAPQQVLHIKKKLKAFYVLYTYPHLPEPKEVRDLDPDQNTIEDLMLRICHQESVGNSKAVCLFTSDGMPLTDDSFFNAWSLKDRHIENGSELYVVFTPKENLSPALPVQQGEKMTEMSGKDNIRCHVMLKGDYDVKVDLASTTLSDLRCKLSAISGIPAYVLHYKDYCGGVGRTLKEAGMNGESTEHFYLSSFSEDDQEYETDFFFSDVEPSVKQTQKGLSAFFSSLYAIQQEFLNEGTETRDPLIEVTSYIRKLSGCSPLAQSLYTVLYKNETGTRTQKIAVVEGLYALFRELLPSVHKRRGEKIIGDAEVFENAPVCWAYLFSAAKKKSYPHDVYKPVNLTSESGQRFCEPVQVPGTDTVFEREYVLQRIKAGGRIPNSSVRIRKETSISRAADIEKILLSMPLFITTFPKWDPSEFVTGQNFQVDVDETFSEMSEAVKDYGHLMVTPPLHLKDIGVSGPRLILLDEDNLGVYISKPKGSPQDILVLDCIAMKEKTLNVDELANKIRDTRSDQNFMTTRTPKEAILVVVDSSSSMNEKCYDSDDKMTRLDAVKQLFDNFATRSMAYNFHHVIGLMKFDSSVKTLHTFTETLETFKDHIHSLEASGCTVLYDALKRGMLQLKEVGEQFPDCRLRIICLTDGKDDGSMTEPDAVTTQLMSSNIVVDAIIVGKEDNNVLHGISNATGGCCFKPETSKAGLKLFEMETVLSLEMRKLKRKLDPSYIKSESVLVALFANRGYDDKPEVALPSGINNKVTVTENVLKRRIQESKSGRFLEKDKRILEELKSLHCDPHPFCTILPSESDLTFWKILMQGPPETPYGDGVFELYCQFGADYPVKPPLMRFVTPVYHCNINSVGRICHNIFDRSYNAHITIREILDAVYGILIVPEPEDPLDSILAEEYLTSREKYEEEAKKNTEDVAGYSLDDLEKKLVGEDLTEKFIPSHLICPLTNKLFVDPVTNPEGTVYERKAIERHLKSSWIGTDPKTNTRMTISDLKPYHEMKKMVRDYRKRQIQENDD
ncbi:hypothetical protein UPYG_G00090320 [Umbra pygmaea]|uniref:Uncharacterized protein n=1 Tax=Umbra pygmaea TaxID=75934 RepID=A0ABD0XFM4_UMBPY